MRKKFELGLLLAFVCVLGVGTIRAGGNREQTSGAIPGDKNPFGKYDPPITVNSSIQIPSGFNYESGDTIDNNPWIRKNHDVLGMDFKWSWVVPLENEYNQKMAASIASGDLPDVFAVKDAQQYAMLIRSGLIWDLTDVFEDYASDFLKEIMRNAPEQREICSYQGRLYSIPYFGSKTGVSVLYVRQDWIDKLGLPNPDSIQNIIKIADAFKNRDPDGNGRNDTVGLLVNQALWPTLNIGGLSEFFAAYHAFPNNGWIKDRSGNLVPGVIQPEVKTALATLAEMYKTGLIDREFINIDYNRATEMVTSGRAGLFYGLFAAPLWFPEMENMNPGAKLMSYPAPSADGRNVEIMVNNPITTYYVVNKKFAHPEALIKAINLHFQVNNDSNLDSQYLMNSPSGYTYHQLSPGWNEVPEKNHTMQQKIKMVLQTREPSGLNPEELNSYNMIQRYYTKQGNIPTDWAIERIFGPDGSAFDTVDYYVRNNMLSLNPFTGAPTRTMTSRLSNLNDLRDEVFTKIIMGTSPLSAFDTFVLDWKRQGGDDITKEVNDWYRTK